MANARFVDASEHGFTIEQFIELVHAGTAERARAMKIIRGTFRLSVVVALLVAVYYGISGYIAARNSEYENWKLWTTLRCGERFLDKDMSGYTNDGRVFDIGRAGCSDTRFLATFEEIREALTQSEPPEVWRGFGEVFRFKLYEALFTALAAFVAVNLAGLLFLGACGLFRWVRSGYR
jgi:predicted PurR-regulated permease PerM